MRPKTPEDEILEYIRMGSIVFSILAFVALGSIPSATNNAPQKLPVARLASAHTDDADLAIALSYEQAGDFKTASTYFAAAAKNAPTREAALAGLKRMQAASQADEMANDRRALLLGDLYRSQHSWAKAEDSYKTALASHSEDIRKKAHDGLAAVLSEQEPDPSKGIVDSIKSWSEAIAILLGFVLLGSYIKVFKDRRNSIHLRPFTAPADDLAKKVGFSIAYARAQMQDPRASPSVTLPASLVALLPTFDDDLPEIEDLEIAGSKLPFASLARVFASAATEVSGGYDGNSPVGYGFALIKTRKQPNADLHTWPVRANSPADLMDFAYHVLVETISAHADV